jgi:hypothetical protein
MADFVCAGEGDGEKMLKIKICHDTLLKMNGKKPFPI